MTTSSTQENELLMQGLMDYREAMIALTRFRQIVWDAGGASFKAHQSKINNLIATKLELKDMKMEASDEFICRYGGNDYTKPLYGFDIGLYWMNAQAVGKSEAYAYASLYMNKSPYMKLSDKLGDEVESPEDANSISGYYLMISRNLDSAKEPNLRNSFDQIINSWINLGPDIRKILAN